ncbi:hypothetical protein PQX77_012264, partial [Marasmius sp. AFHP31]
LGFIAAIIIAIGISDPDSYELGLQGNSIRLGFTGASAGANLLVTVFTASRIWWLSRETRECFGRGTHGLHRRIVAIILESGFLYPVSSFVHLALKQSASEIGCPITLLPTVTLMAGIAPALMIVRCRVFNAVQNHTVREAGTLSTLQFNSKAGAATTVEAAQIESQAVDVEAQSESSSSPVDDSMGDSNAHDKEKEQLSIITVLPTQCTPDLILADWMLGHIDEHQQYLGGKRDPRASPPYTHIHDLNPVHIARLTSAMLELDIG